MAPSNPIVPPLDRSFTSTIIDHVAHPIFVKDRQFRFVLMNRAFCAMVGLSAETLVGKTDHDFFPLQEADFFRAKDQELFSTARDVVVDEEPFTDSNGVRHILATTKVPLRDGSGAVTHLVGIIHDITRLKQAEDALRQANEALEQRVKERTEALAAAQQELIRKERMAVLGQLAGGLAHQIRNPLGSIVNAAAVLKRAVPDATPDMRLALDAIIQDSWTANRIITDLVDFARVRAPQRRQVTVESLFGQTMGRQNVPDTVKVDWVIATLPPLEVDLEQLSAALGNLVRNALDVMPHGGVLTLSAREVGGALVLGVADTGPGIALAIAARLFEPLVTDKPLGLGLGLTTAKLLVESHGGKITGANRPEGGARFEITLPPVVR